MQKVTNQEAFMRTVFSIKKKKGGRGKGTGLFLQAILKRNLFRSILYNPGFFQNNFKRYKLFGSFLKA